jgi:hypothetical protein
MLQWPLGTSSSFSNKARTFGDLHEKKNPERAGTPRRKS